MPYRWIMEAADQPLKKVDFDLPELQAGEVVVEVAGCGVCHTDLGFYYDGVRTNQPLPLALGHEISGHVTAAGPGGDGLIGQAVVIPAVMPCGECDLCQRGKGTICPHQKMPGNDMHGGFASHIVVPARGLCPVDEARLDRAGLTLADVSVLADAVTTPYQAVSQAEMRPGALAVVVGAGGVGGYCVQIAKAFGAHVVALDIDPAKLEQAAAAGAELTLDVRDKSGKELKKAILAHAREHELPTREWAIFECSGSAPGQQTAYDLLVHGATLAIVGFTMAKLEVRLSNLMAFHARALGNWGCVPEHYPAALELVLDGQVNLRDFVEHHPLDSINDIFAKAHGHELTRRAILIP
jgi:6-hydroxycyclohex-1-ene-1-carbonyl-CoA dehydrogenase